MRTSIATRFEWFKSNAVALVGISAAVFLSMLLAPDAYAGPESPQDNRVEVTTAQQAAVMDDESVTPLMRAARDGDFRELRALLKHNSDLNAKDAWGWTALIYAARKGDSSIMKALIERGADLTATDESGTTALMYAAGAGNAEIVKLLLEKGVDVNARSNYGMTALHFADQNGQTDVGELLKQAGAIAFDHLLAATPRLFPSPGIETRPVALNHLYPSYTEKARKNKVSGQIDMRLLVGIDGDVKKVRILTGLPDGLSEEAARTAYQLKFEPAMMTDGQPVEFWLPISMDFNIR